MGISKVSADETSTNAAGLVQEREAAKTGTYWIMVWTRLLVRRLTTKRTHGRTGHQHTARALRIFASPIGAMVRKELLTWRRDFTRSGFVYFALFFSLFLCRYPVAAGSMANVYGADGSALWMTLNTPHATRYDICGRQIAWLLIVAPIALLITFFMTALTYASRQ